MPRIGRSAWLAAALLLVSCGQVSSSAVRRRPVVRPAPIQWEHEWAHGAVFYEIFVRSFADSDGDGIGDFDGLTARLDYLNDGDPATATDLGIDGIWLMPAFEATSYHGYDTIDYEAIERDYGTSDDFQEFLDAAHARGIRVILDLVLNHTGVEHPWFTESASAPGSPKRDWYVWSSVDPGWKQPWGGPYGSWHFRNGAWYYGAFWSGMPDVNYRSAGAREEMLRIARHWLARGVDGYRLDATRYLVETSPGPGQSDTPETHAVLKEVSSTIRRMRPDAIVVAENWIEDPVQLAAYFGSTGVIRGGDEMPMNFDFPLAFALVDGVQRGDAGRIRTALDAVLRAFPAGFVDVPFLTNHDQPRLATILANDPGKLRNAAAILLTLPGMPFLYYGEEVGLQNGPTPADESKRTPMPWTPAGGFTAGTPWHPYAPGLAANNVAAQTADPASLLTHYRGWIAARNQNRALRKGTITPLESGPAVFAFVRASGAARAVVVHNLSALPVTAGPFPLEATALEPIHVDPGVGTPLPSPDGWLLSLPPHASGAWSIP